MISILTILFLLFTSWHNLQLVYAFHFVDEEHAMTLGHYLLQGEILYRDLLTNHQPFETIISAIIQRLSHPITIQQLITRHRQFIIFYSFVWQLLLLWQFKKKIIPWIIVYQCSQSFLLGQLFLSESLVVYPLILVCGWLIFLKPLTPISHFIIGLLSAFLFFLLEPLWPLILFLNLCIWKKADKKISAMVLTTLGFLVIAFSLLPFVDLKNYLLFTIISNLQVTIPATSYFGPWYVTLPQSFFALFLSWLLPVSSPLLWIIRGLSLLWIITLLSCIKARRLSLAFLSFVLPGLSNLRFYPPNEIYYQGFHLLPWFAVSLFFSTTLLPPKKRTWVLLSLLCCLSLGLYFQNQNLAPNQKQQFDINYSSQQNFGSIIQQIKQPGETVYVFPDQWLIYWQSQAPHLSQAFGDYLWASHLPTLREQILNNFQTEPPTYLYCNRCSTTDFAPFLGLYQQIQQDQKATDLYILKSKMQQLTPTQKNSLSFYRVTF